MNVPEGEEEVVYDLMIVCVHRRRTCLNITKHLIIVLVFKYASLDERTCNVLFCEGVCMEGKEMRSKDDHRMNIPLFLVSYASTSRAPAHACVLRRLRPLRLLRLLRSLRPVRHCTYRYLSSILGSPLSIVLSPHLSFPTMSY